MSHEHEWLPDLKHGADAVLTCPGNSCPNQRNRSLLCQTAVWASCSTVIDALVTETWARRRMTMIREAGCNLPPILATPQRRPPAGLSLGSGVIHD